MAVSQSMMSEGVSFDDHNILYIGPPGIWDLSGGALRTAIDLGMHQKPIYREARSRINYLERDMGSRLFWAYV